MADRGSVQLYCGLGLHQPEPDRPRRQSGLRRGAVDEGKPAIQALRYDTQDDATNAVILGKADALSADSPVTLYAISKSNGKLQEAGKTFDEAPYGLPVKKDSKLTPVLQKAVQALIDDGTYKKILDKWGVADGAVESAEVNAASKG